MKPKEVTRRGAELRGTLEKKLAEDDAPQNAKDSMLAGFDLLLGLAYNIACLAHPVDPRK